MPSRPSAGVLCVTDDSRVLLMRRSDACDNHPGVWAIPGGGIEEGERPDAAARRELFEEAGQEIEFADFAFEVGDFSLFIHRGAKFSPALNEENDGAVWAKPDALPQPLYPGTDEVIAKALKAPDTAADAEMANDRFAFDESVRLIDQDGRLRVAVSNISKSNVCDYLGREIPNWEALGLSSRKIYKLLRHPEELAKAAHTFNGIPILDTHVPSTAWDHPHGRVVGTTGTEAKFEPPYLKNSLIIWTEEAIDGIESNKQRELSCGYRYQVDMTPGTFEGEAYDGVMREILGNHVALVEDGRAGTDVIVGDSKLEITPIMKPKAMTHKAALAKGALLASVRLAADKKLDLDSLLGDVTDANWSAKKVAIAAAIKPLLAADANIESVVRLLDTLDNEESELLPDPDATAAIDVDPEADSDVDPDAGAIPGTVEDVPEVDPAQEILAFLQDKLSPEDLAAISEKISACTGKSPMVPVGSDEPEQTPGAPDPERDDADAGATPAPKEDFVSKAAMDSAVHTATKKAVVRMNAMLDAKEVVKPYVGTLTMSYDSAESVYQAALETLGVDVKGVHPSAYGAILRAQPLPNAKMANDSKLRTPTADVATRFPGLAAIRTV